MRPTRVLILYNEPILPVDHPDADSEHEILFTADVVSKTLVQAGFEVSRLGANRDPAVLTTGIQSLRPDVVFNLFEGTADHGNTEAYSAGLLEWLGLPYTGSPFKTLCVARDKPLAKRLFQGAGLPTPDFFAVESLPVPPCTLEWPVIVKPALQDASVGLDQGSVVTDQPALEARVRYLLENYGPPVLVEQFIRGRELTVGLIEAPELKTLPVSEILFVEKDPGYWPIVTYDAKWKPGTPDYEATPPRYPADVTPKLAEKLGTLAAEAFRLLGCRDYARVDFRVRPSGKAYILEVNPNPDFSPNAGLAGGLTSAGLTHARFTVDLVRAALARGKGGRPEQPGDEPAATVRPAVAGDRAAVRKLVETCVEFRPDELVGALATVESWLADGSSGHYHGWVILLKERIVGFAALRKVAATEYTFHLDALALEPGHRGKGYGLSLWREVEADLRKRGGRTVVVETSSQPATIRGRQFLLRHGFRPAGEVPDFFREAESRLTYVKFLDVPSPAASS